MADVQSPHQKLRMFLAKIGITDDEMARLDSVRPLFIGRKDAFADCFYDFFHDMADTRALLENEKTPGLMKRVWAAWFESFFRAKPDDTFLAYLWKVGVKHVEVNLDQRYSNLGFAMIRQFCHNIVSQEVPPAGRAQILSTIDKMLDLCILTETTAYIENTVSCDIEVMSEVADRVRNPAMVIGWNIKKLQGKVSEETPEYKTYKMLMAENERLENMVHDIKVYMELFQGEPQLQNVSIPEIIDSVCEKFEHRNADDRVQISVDCKETACHLKGDSKWLEYLFHYLIENSIEAVDRQNPVIRISSEIESAPPFNVRIEIFNTGSPPREEVGKLFSPFFSTKATGTGFGLPIARLVVKKHHGTLSIGPAQEKEGVNVVISLPNPEG
jgi:signal transduction histidine kinase